MFMALTLNFCRNGAQHETLCNLLFFFNKIVSSLNKFLLDKMRWSGLGPVAYPAIVVIIPLSTIGHQRLMTNGTLQNLLMMEW